MQKQVYDYFIDLEKSDLPQFKNVFSMQSESIVPTSEHIQNLQIYTIDNIPFFFKTWGEEYAVAGMISSKMYSNLGLITPPVYLFTKDLPNNLRDYLAIKYAKTKPILKTATQNVMSIDGVECKMAYEVLPRRILNKLSLYNHKWQILYDNEYQKTFLKYMTRECLDQLIDMFLLDELRTDNDRHTSNYFFYKKIGSEKFEGVIPIDLENLQILSSPSTKSGFQNFLSYPYNSSTPQTTTDNLAYSKRIENIRELLNDGILGERRIKLLKDELAYDLPKETKKILDNPYLNHYKKEICPAIARLWEYNQKTLGKDLEI